MSATTDPSDRWVRIQTKDEYLTQCADQYFGEDGGQSIATRHGQISGVFDGQILRGTWEWDDGFFSRTSTIGDIDLGADRIVIEMTDTQMRLTMQEGSGPEVVYDRKPLPPADVAADDDVTICSSFRIKSEGIDPYIEAMVENQAAVRAETGNLEMRMFQDVSDAGVFFVFGRTAGAEGLGAHSESVEDRGIEQRVAPTLAEPPVVRPLRLTGQGAAYGPREREVRDDELIVLTLVQAAPGQRDGIVAGYDQQIPVMRADPSNVLFNAYTIDEGADGFVTYERWTSEAGAAAFSDEIDGLLGASTSSVSRHVVHEIAPY